MAIASRLDAARSKKLVTGGAVLFISQVAPLIEKVRVAQETTESAKLQLREANEMRNKCLTSSNKKLLVTGATLVVTSALLVVTRSY